MLGLDVCSNRNLSPNFCRYTVGINFDAKLYSSGIYLYRLKSDGASFTKKFMVIK